MSCRNCGRPEGDPAAEDISTCIEPFDRECRAVAEAQEDLRDGFAMAALGGMLGANLQGIEDMTPDAFISASTITAYKFADAMLAARRLPRRAVSR